jgi:hypothetical protein
MELQDVKTAKSRVSSYHVTFFQFRSKAVSNIIKSGIDIPDFIHGNTDFFLGKALHGRGGERFKK